MSSAVSGCASITIPSLVMVGTNDQTTPATPNVDRPWDLSNSAPSYRVDLLDELGVLP